MFIFVLRYISDKNLFKEIINDSDEINLRIKNRIKTIFKVIIFYIIFYKVIELLTYQFFNVNDMKINFIDMFRVIIRFMIEKMIKIPTVIFIITFIIFILNDLIYLIVIKFINRLK